MRAYSVFDRIAGSFEGACLVIANNSKEAKKLGWPVIHSWGSDEYIDMGIRWIRKPNQQIRDLLEADVKVIIESPTTCSRCEMWGGELNSEHICESCLELEQS